MDTLAVDAKSLAKSGAEALRKGDLPRARESFERIVAAGKDDASVCIALAHACHKLADKPAAAAAIDRALALEPGNVVALLFKADHLAAQGDERAASSFYRAVVNAAAPAAEQLSEELRAEVARAQSMCDRYAAQFESFLKGRLAGLEGTPRFQHSLDLLCGRKQVYFQQPRYYFFPELPQVQFYDRALFPWLDKVEAATPAIRAELLQVMADSSAFTPYVQSDPNRPPAPEENAMVNNPAWGAFYLWKNGEVVAENAARCPETMRALADVPLTQVPGRSPSVLFSLLKPGAHIPPHSGFINTRLICHLPLVVPWNCGLRVGNETRTPVEGKAWVFDDTIEHEAWNSGNRARAILLFEIWRPELTAEEREIVSAMLQAIDAYGGDRVAWEI